jgi:rhamnogalacturonyl hydrolase YesR
MLLAARERERFLVSGIEALIKHTNDTDEEANITLGDFKLAEKDFLNDKEMESENSDEEE